MNELTEKQENVKRFIVNFTDENGFPPTVREISEEFNLSLRAAYDRLTALEKKGHLKKMKGCGRTIKIINEVA